MSGIANISPVAAELMGARESRRGTELTSLVDHIMRQIPLVNQYGKVLQAVTQPDSGTRATFWVSISTRSHTRASLFAQ